MSRNATHGKATESRMVSALELVGLGFRVIALKPGRKEPMRAGWQRGATSDGAR